MSVERLLRSDLDLKIWRAAIDPSQSAMLLTALSAGLSWRQDEITMFGKTHLVPRLSAWHGDPDTTYSYSGIRLEPEPWTDDLQAARMAVEQVCGVSFNSVLVNRYRDGADSMGWHSDDEAELGAQPVIASLSLGASRKFDLRRKDNHNQKVRLELNHGDLVVMASRTQEFWAHQVPKTATEVGERVNLTFRTVLARE